LSVARPKLRALLQHLLSLVTQIWSRRHTVDIAAGCVVIVMVVAIGVQADAIGVMVAVMCIATVIGAATAAGAIAIRIAPVAITAVGSSAYSVSRFSCLLDWPKQRTPPGQSVRGAFSFALFECQSVRNAISFVTTQ